MSAPGKIAAYRNVLAVHDVRNALLLGLLLRIPIFAGSVVLTLHVVGALGRNYAAAGLLTAAATVCIAISGPWRGRLLDRRGLRGVVLPSVLITGACWSVAPFVGYWPLLGLAALAGLFVVPTFSIIRQAVIVAVPDESRRTALSLDSVFVELSFMIGPVAGVWAATVWPTSWVLFVIEMLGVAAGLVLWVANPALRTEVITIADSGDAAGPPRAAPVPLRHWFTPGVAAVLAAALAATVVLSGSDIAIVAALRQFGDAKLIGPVLALWGLGSVIGGLVYGALSRPIAAFMLLGGLALVTLPVALSTGTLMLTVLTFISGLLCAPTITATVDQLSQVVPEASRGEAMGWHGSSMTAGSALGAPVAGVAIDVYGFGGGFVAVSLIGLLIAVVGWSATAVRSRRVVVPS